MSYETSPRWKLPNRPRQKFGRYLIIITVVLLTLSTLKFVLFGSRTPTKIQYAFEKDSLESQAQPDRLRAVKREFLHAWTGYKDHSWMSDSLNSVSGTRANQFCGWSATVVDTLDTLWIMGLEEEFEEALNATLMIDFAESALSCQVNLFESTIRYLGGMLAAFDLSADERLLVKLVELGELLQTGFNSENGMPCSHCSLGRGTDESYVMLETSVPLADLGSFYLEFARLWQITKNEKYLETVIFLTDLFQDFQNKSSIPGLWPERLNPTAIEGEDATFVAGSSSYSLGALSDSAYEYLVKSHLMLGRLTDQYESMWKQAVTQIRRLLLFRAYTPTAQEHDLLFSGVATRSQDAEDFYLEARTQHLACFAGGMFAMASRVFNEPSDMKIGEALTNGCVWAYNATVTGIMPETFSLLACPDDLDGSQCEWNATLWQEERSRPVNCNYGNCNTTSNYPEGYLSSIDTHYSLRPEAIESVFIMYRMTGNQYWRDVGWQMFTSIIEHTRTPFGHAALTTVMELYPQIRYVNGKEVIVDAAMQRDEMESFWLAETLKYFYLLFSESDLIDLDQYVLNTEAHPLRLVKSMRGFP